MSAPKLKTSAMIASIAAEGDRTVDAPFGHALVELARSRDDIVGMTAFDGTEQTRADQQNHGRRDAETARQAALKFGEKAVGVVLALRLEHVAARGHRGAKGRDNSLPGRGRTLLRLSHRSREASSTIH